MFFSKLLASPLLKPLLYVLAGLLLVGALFFVYDKGGDNREASMRIELLEAQEEARVLREALKQDSERNERQIRSLDDDALKRRFLDSMRSD
jgi:hypothetical protein